MRSMRVLSVVDSLDVGGAERVAVGLAAGLAARGSRITMAASAGGSLAVDARRAGIEVVVVGDGRLVKRRSDAGFAAGIAALAARGFDVIHAHSFASVDAATAAARATGLPLVVHEHSEAAWRSDADRQRSALHYRTATAVLAASHGIATRLRRVDHVPAAKLRTLPSVLWPLIRQPEQWSPPPGDGPLIGVVARLHRDKGIDVFICAASHVARRLAGARFVVVGDGPARAELEQLAARTGARITFTGFRADGPAIIGHLDALVVPSRFEGTPLVVWEAANAGVPVVATRVGGIPEQLRDGVEALLVEPEDDVGLADAVCRLVTGRRLAVRLTDAARRRCRAVADAGAVVDVVEALYREVQSPVTAPVP
jgi:glycosyltransferase involved in cell wall biosynthesis